MYPKQVKIRHSAIRRNGAAILAVLLLAFAGALFAQDQDTGAQPLVMRPGSVLTVRIDQALSSDRNKPGDSFSATLTQPVVVQGIVIAQRGQTVTGQIVDVERGHGFSGSSRLQLALTRLTLVDGQSVPLHTQLLTNRGRASTGRDVGAVGATTATGAIIGAAAGRGEGAAIGAGAGAAAGVIGVLLTKGYPTIVYPESLLAFETTISVAIDTTEAPQAFHVVDPSTYARNAEPQLQPRQQVVEEVVTTPPVVVAPPRVIYPVGYDPYYGPCDPYFYPYCYGPQFRVIIGRPYYRGYYYRYPRYYGRPYIAPPVRWHNDYRRDYYRHDFDRGRDADRGRGGDHGRGGRDGGGRRH